ncbi:putative TPR repeat methyltransferase [Bradyrhizobium sp. JR6.1]
MAPRLFLSSGDLVADRRYEFARDLQLKGDLPAAAELLEQAIELVPKFPSAWYTLGNIRLELGQRDAAIAAFRAARDADPEDRHGAGLHLMQLGVEAVGAMPPGYVQTLFDQYAPRFEAALVGDLGYRGPALLFKAVLSVCAPQRGSRHSSSARSISAAAPDWRPVLSRSTSTASSASTCRRA